MEYQRFNWNELYMSKGLATLFKTGASIGISLGAGAECSTIIACNLGSWFFKISLAIVQRLPLGMQCRICSFRNARQGGNIPELALIIICTFIYFLYFSLF